MLMCRPQSARLKAITMLAAPLVCACSPSADNPEGSNDGVGTNLSAVDVAESNPVSIADQGPSIENSKDAGSAETDAASSVLAAPTEGKPQAKSLAGSLHVAKTRRAAIVLGALRPGRLEVVNGCLTVKMVDQAIATAVLPPDGRVLKSRGAPSAVTYGIRSLPIGQDTRIPGGGSSVTANDLVSKVPTNCPKRLFPIGG